MKVALIAATAATALIGASVASVAQQQNKQDRSEQTAPGGNAPPAKAPAAESGPAGSGQNGTAPRAQPQEKSRADEGRRTNQNASPGEDKQNRRNGRDAAQSPSDKAAPERGAQKPDQKPDQKSERPTQKGAEKDNGDARRGRDNQATEPRAKSDGDRTGQNADDRNGKQANPDRRANDRSKDRDRTANPTGKADSPSKSNEQAQRGNNAPPVQLSDDQRTRVQSAFRDQKGARASRVNFTVNIGSRVPRTVQLVVLPAVVVEVVPEYRNYRYVVANDRICIVDPVSYEIVYVLDSGPASNSARSVRLELNPDQREFIVSRVRVSAPARVRTRLALGARIPQSVELVSFPEEVIIELPQLREYRYVTIDRGLALVDPSDRDIVLIINR